MRCCRRLAIISKDPQVKAAWIIYQFGAAHCLFYAVKLGPSYLDVAVAQAIIAQGGILSRYFVQRLHMNFGASDEKLIELKAAHGIGSSQSQDPQNIPWASNLPINVYIFLLKEATRIYGPDLCLKGNDMELFHFYSGGPHTIHYAPLVLTKNMDQIKDLILRFKFIPLPPRKLDIQPANNNQENNSSTSEEYPPKDGHENNRQLNVIARSILICKDIVNLWKEIGYYEICHDVNDLVMQGSLLIMFPPTPSSRWSKPDIKTINARLTELIEIGFQLNHRVILDILLVFEKRLEEIGKILIESFAETRHESLVNLLRNCLIETINPKSKFKSENIMNFVYDFLPDSSEIEFNRAFEFSSKFFTI
ncbi:5994_t:CDS:1 [Cetraspora pellucida]|uniref:5994_t:CDS:1 n=1 Tax=Cetraspora pellucida TaxID=1433469 RepID=A0ACA9KA87_9GLOM|nr:5994_t:CDS:1 [Cetraspora pellucida]